MDLIAESLGVPVDHQAHQGFFSESGGASEARAARPFSALTHRHECRARWLTTLAWTAYSAYAHIEWPGP